MNTTEKFENGLSIVQLEERYEMLVAESRDRQTNIDIHTGPDYIGVGTHFNF